MYDYKDNDLFPQVFELLISGRDMIILPLDHSVNGFIEPESINYYESLIPEKGYVIVEMSSCVGDMRFGYSQNYA